jgi:hypothetical protein
MNTPFRYYIHNIYIMNESNIKIGKYVNIAI